MTDPTIIKVNHPNSSDAINYFATEYTQKIRPLKDNADLAQYFTLVYSIIMLGFKEQYPKTQASGAMRFKSDHSSELKFQENMTEKGKNGQITKNQDGSFDISCTPPTDIVAGKFVVKPYTFPYFRDMNCMSFMRDEIQEHIKFYDENERFHAEKYKPSQLYLNNHPNNKYPVQLGVPIVEYIDHAIALLDKTLEILESDGQSEANFKANQQILLENLDKIKSSFYERKKEKYPNISKKRVDEFFDLLTTSSYEEYRARLMAYNTNLSASHPGISIPKPKYLTANQDLIQTAQKQKERYLELKTKILENPELYNNNPNAENIEINKFIKNNPDLDFFKLLETYRGVFSDRYTLTASQLQFTQIFNPNTTSGKLLRALGVTHSKKKSKISAKENGFLSIFEYIDTPLGTFEFRIETEMRREIQTTGKAAHAEANKAPVDISFEESEEPENVLSKLNYAVPITVHFHFSQKTPTEFSVRTTKDGLVTSYLNICSEFNTNDSQNDVKADNLRAKKKRARAYQAKNFPSDDDISEEISYYSVLSSIRALLEGQGKIYDNFYDNNILQMDVVHEAITDYMTYIKAISKDCALPCSDENINLRVSKEEVIDYLKSQAEIQKSDQKLPKFDIPLTEESSRESLDD